MRLRARTTDRLEVRARPGFRTNRSSAAATYWKLRALCAEWRTLLAEEPPIAQQIVRRMLTDRLTVERTPEGIRLTGMATFGPLMASIVLRGEMVPAGWDTCQTRGSPALAESPLLGRSHGCASVPGDLSPIKCLGILVLSPARACHAGGTYTVKGPRPSRTSATGAPASRDRGPRGLTPYYL